MNPNQESPTSVADGRDAEDDEMRSVLGVIRVRVVVESVISRVRAVAETSEISIERARVVDLPVLLPLVRAYCDFYDVAPRDDRLVALSRALIDDSREGVQLLARDADGRALGFASIFWSWSTLAATRTGVMNDLYVIAEARGRGLGLRLIERCRGECRKRGASLLVWETAPDNAAAQSLYESTGARSSTWLAYELEAW